MKKISNYLTCISTLILVVGCTASIPKYKTVQIDTSVFEVRISNPDLYKYSKRELMMNTTLKAAAKKSIEIECSYFIAIDNNNQKFNAPQGSVTEGLTRMANGQVIYSTGTGQIYTVIRPDVAVNTFICFKQKPNALLPGLVFNADLVLKSLE